MDNIGIIGSNKMFLKLFKKCGGKSESPEDAFRFGCLSR